MDEVSTERPLLLSVSIKRIGGLAERFSPPIFLLDATEQMCYQVPMNQCQNCKSPIRVGVVCVRCAVIAFKRSGVNVTGSARLDAIRAIRDGGTTGPRPVHPSNHPEYDHKQVMPWVYASHGLKRTVHWRHRPSKSGGGVYIYVEGCPHRLVVSNKTWVTESAGSLSDKVKKHLEGCGKDG